MSIYSISTPFHIELKLNIASFPKRLAAWMIDFLVIYVYNLILALFIFSNLAELGTTYFQKMDTQQMLLIICIFIPSTFYHLISQLLWNGRSFGKYVMRLRVVNIHDGGAASKSQILVRNLLTLLNFFLAVTFFAINPMALFGIMVVFTIIAAPDIITVLINNKSQKIGDIIGGTIVVDTTAKADLQQTIFKEVHNAQNYEFAYPLVSRLTDNEINGLNKILIHTKLYQIDYIDSLAERVAQKLETDIKEYDAIDFLHKVVSEYNYYHQKEK